MATEHIFPDKLTDFDHYLGIAVPYLNLVTNTPRLISAGNLTILNGFYITPLTGWTTKYPQSIDPTLSTHTIRDQRDTLRTQLETTLRSVFADIPASTLTATDRDKLGLRAHDTVPTHAARMDHAPQLEITRREHLQHTVKVHDPSNPDTKAMPEHQHVVLEMFIGAAGLAPADIAFANAQNITRALHDVPFTESDVAKTVYYRCTYESTRGERSVWSAVVSGVIG